jgi:hypothetical protein
MIDFLNLSLRGGAMARLCILKNRAAYTNAHDVNLPPSRRFADWRVFRAQAMDVERHDDLSPGQQSDGARIWYTHGDGPFRHERYADEVNGAHIDHTGWFISDEQDEKTRGIVGGLTHGRYIAGYEDAGGARVYFDRVYDDEREAARGADREAEIVAESEREYNARWKKAQSLRDDAEEAEKRLRAYLAARNDKRTAARELAEMEIENLRSIRAELADYSDIER